MRDWMRNRMRRRGKRGPNNSEATGKIGQEIPQNQPAALQPMYHEAHTRPSGADDEPALDLLAAADSAGGQDFAESEAPGKIEVETQPEILAGPPVEPAAIPAGEKATPRGYVVLAIGLPGSGKTTWFKRRGVTPLSSDLLRTILFDDITDQRYSGLVFSTLRSLLRARLIAKMPWNYVDATNLSAHERRQWIKMAKSFGYEAQAVYFDVPLELCIERNSKRERRVADDVMQKMAERLRPPSFREGFSKITVVRVKGQPGNTPSGTEPDADAFNKPLPADLDEPPVALDLGSEEPAADQGSASEESGAAGSSQVSDEPSGRLEVIEAGETSVR